MSCHAKMCSLYIVRHGVTSWNQEGRIQGHTDIDLAPEGEAQAQELSKSLQGVSFGAAYASDLSRARRTADIIAAERNLEVVTSPLLRERYWGRWEGMFFSELSKKFNQYFEYQEEHELVVTAESAEIESYHQVARRVVPYFLEVGREHLGKNVLMVSHGGILKTLLYHLKDAKFSNPYIDNTGYLHVETDGEKLTLKRTHGITNGHPIHGN